MSLLKFFKKKNRYLSSEEDYLNVYHTRDHLNTDIWDYNCAGYCLNAFSWYDPYENYCINEGFHNITELAEALIIDSFYSKKEAYETLIEIGREQILQDFSDTVRLIHNSSEIKSDEKLVVYKIGIVIDTDQNGNPYIKHADFHFKQWENKYWTDKLGSCKVRIEKKTVEENVNEVWRNSWWDNEGYDSVPVLFAVKKN